jgi:hypothetical protein
MTLRVTIDTVLSIPHHKFLIHKDCTIGQFMCKLRTYMKLKPEEALFLSVRHKKTEYSVGVAQIMSQVYNEYHDKDVVEFVLRSEEVFG